MGERRRAEGDDAEAPRGGKKVATEKKWDELSDIAAGGTGQTAQMDGTAAQSIKPVDVSAITQKYYTTPTNADNYESGRPVYEQSQAVKDAAAALSQKQAQKPGEYQSAYGDQIQGMIDQLLNRPKFTYDFASDPMYQQYAEQYQRNGQLAMKDAMAQSAALTGGYGNSYAQQVGQQTYQRYLENLNDVIPELRDAAYQMYQNEGDTLRSNLGMLQTQDATDYGRYRDTVSDYNNDLNFLYQQYGDMSKQEYEHYLNDAAAWEADRAYWYQKAQDELAQANWEKEFNAQYGSSSGGGGGRRRSTGTDEDDESDVTTYYLHDSAIGSNQNTLNAVAAYRARQEQAALESARKTIKRSTGKSGASTK